MPQDENRLLKASDALLDSCKQQIAIAGILVSLSITLNKNLVPENSHLVFKFLLASSWVLLSLSIIFGLFFLGRAVYELADTRKSLHDQIERLRLFGFLQLLLLVLGIVILMIPAIVFIGS